ncbi:staphylopine family metallophore export MFS transporter CntE [Paenibacillus sp. GCM10027627]|uniref:staphylopine family metallophore export MFS transporter CntE n=1 Tax=unclassified Paenibacillus TaxID=185978 RepID=UPI00363575E6
MARASFPESRSNPFSPQALKIYAITILFYAVVYMVLMVIPFYAASLDATKTDIGLIMGVTMLASMAARPVAGKWIDRFGAQRIFSIVLCVFAFSLLGYFFPSLWMFGLVRLVQGIVAAFFSTAMEIMTIDLLSDKVRGQGLSLYSLATMIPSTFGPAVALALKDSIPMTGMLWSFVAMAALNVAFAFFVIITKKRPSAVEGGGGGRQEEQEHVSHSGLWRNRSLLVSSLIMLLMSIANGAIFTFLPLYLTEKQSAWGSSYFLVQTLVLVGCRFFGRKRIPSDGRAPKAIVCSMGLMAAAGTLLLSLSAEWPFLLLAAVFNGIAFAMLYPALLTFVSFNVPSHARGFLLGLFIGAADLGFSLGALAMGPLADASSLRFMFICCSVICLLSITMTRLYRSERLKGKRQLEKTESFT